MATSSEKSYFWAITLDADHKEYKWDGLSTENTDDMIIVNHTLAVRQAVVGPGCKEGELQVVEMEAVGYNNKKMKAPVFASLGVCTVPTELLLTDQVVTFRLTHGSGPVYISGTHATENTVHPDDEDEEDGLLEPEEDDIEEEEEDMGPVRRNGSTAGNKRHR
ncbi:Nucleoplasmin core domain [Trinorchestia longiramus]|nr:Nucleoplasmin core domain [Trinorchestia longiramus]